MNYDKKTKKQNNNNRDHIIHNDSSSKVNIHIIKDKFSIETATI